MSYSGDESSSDGSGLDNEKRIFNKRPKSSNDALDASVEIRPRIAVRNAESSESLKDERGWIQWTKEEVRQTTSGSFVLTVCH